MPSMTNFRTFGEKKYLLFGIVIIVILSLVVTMNIPTTTGKEEITVYLTVDYGSSTTREALKVLNQTTVFDALNQTHNVQYKEYSIGLFIISIDNVTQNSTHSWLYFVNGEPPMISADNYHLNNNDEVLFKFVSNEEAMKYFE